MKITTFGEILELQRGYDLPASAMVKGNIPVAGSNGVIGYHNVSKVQPPCITVGRSGSVGKVHFYNEPIWAHNTSLFVSDFKGNNQKYIYYLLKSKNFAKLCDSSVVPSLNRNFVYPIKTLFEENKDKQQKIAAVLSALDDKIALNRRMNAKLEQMAKRLYDHWFVQFDFPNADGKPYKSSGGKMEYNEVLKREIPAGWEVKSIFDACDLLYGFPYATEPFDEDDLVASKKPYKIVRIRDIQNNSYSAKRTEDVDDKYRTKRNDLLFGMDGYFHMNFWTRNDDYINQRIVRLRKTHISTLILYFQIMPFIKFKEEKAKGSTVGHLSDKDLKQLFVVIPNNEFLSNHFETILNMKTRLNAEIEKLSATRDRLLLLLINGQVEVK